MAEQQALIRATALQSVGGAFAAGFSSGRRGTKAPEWVEGRVLSFVGAGRAVVQLADGTVREVALTDIRMLG